VWVAVYHKRRIFPTPGFSDLPNGNTLQADELYEQVLLQGNFDESS